MIFVSYSRRNQSLVHPLVQFLRASGQEVFVDVQDLRHGDDWRAGLHEAIDKSDRFLLFWSAAARDSEVVTEEWQRAAQRTGARIIPVMLDKTPLPPELKRFHGMSELAEVFQGMIRARQTSRWLWVTWAAIGPVLGTLAILAVLMLTFQHASPGETPRDLPWEVDATPAWLAGVAPWLGWQLIVAALVVGALVWAWWYRRRLLRRAVRLLAA